ncbi:MAG TPA: hypothetical protein VKZ97_10800 [Flavobacteriaceae bacterium]|nr:hypothetical protein [Flavobacteriaceae bacterium]
MKKYITICGFLMAFLAGGQFVGAQEAKTMEDVKSKAKLNVEMLDKLADLDEDQEKKAFKAFYGFGNDMFAISQDKKAEPRKPILLESFDNTMKSILNDKQYQIFVDNKEELGVK